MIEQEGNFEFTLRTFVGHVNLSMAKSQAMSIRISVGNFVPNP